MSQSQLENLRSLFDIVCFGRQNSRSVLTGIHHGSKLDENTCTTIPIMFTVAGVYRNENPLSDIGNWIHK